MSQQALVQTQEYFLIVINGPDKGTRYRLTGAQARIGRDADNDIVINDDVKVSRKHAVIALTFRGVEISDVSDKNKVFVNNEQVSTVLLKHQDIITLGSTKMKFTNAGNSDANLALVADGAIGSQEVGGPAQRNPRPKKATGPNPVQIIIGILVVGGIWLMSSNTGTKKPVVELKTNQQADDEIESAQAELAKAEELRTLSQSNSPQYESAKTSFIKGYRDYRKGQYERAREAFQACLALFPTHLQCQRYLSLANKRFDEVVQSQMLAGIRFKKQGQYASCKAAFRNVMVMRKEPTDKVFREAESNFKVCTALEKEGY
jgi:pSer/pThr/pTyr-binding forkhead associated (FHA) protein